MSTQITNRASLTYSYGCKVCSTLSNTATTTLQGPLTVHKTALSSCYCGEPVITYVVSITNTTCSVLTGLTLSDDMGSYTAEDSCDCIAPIELCGNAALYINGCYTFSPDACVGVNGTVFHLGNLGAADNAMLIYNVRPTDFFYPEQNACIRNTATVTADGISESACDTCCISVGCFADVSIVKTMSPDPVTCGDQITYTFRIYNYGNLPAENIILRDSFSPAPRISSVRVNGETVSTSSYTYDSVNLNLPLDGVCVPAASYSRECGGRVVKTPGLTTVTVTGIIA